MSSEREKLPSSRRILNEPFWRRVRRQWLPIIIGVLALTALIFGVTGFAIQYDAAKPAEPDWTIPFFKTIQLFLLNSSVDIDAAHPNNWCLTVARLAAALWFLVISSAVVARIVAEVRKLPF